MELDPNEGGGEERDALTNRQLCFRAHAEPMGGRRVNRTDPSII